MYSFRSTKITATSCLECACVCQVASVVSDSLWPLWIVASQASLSMGFSRQEYWSELPCPPLGDFPNPGIQLAPFRSPSGKFFTNSATWDTLCQKDLSKPLKTAEVGLSMSPHSWNLTWSEQAFHMWKLEEPSEFQCSISGFSPVFITSLSFTALQEKFFHIGVRVQFNMISPSQQSYSNPRKSQVLWN